VEEVVTAEIRLHLLLGAGLVRHCHLPKDGQLFSRFPLFPPNDVALHPVSTGVNSGCSLSFGSRRALLDELTVPFGAAA
jgi:hypothetical protein